MFADSTFLIDFLRGNPAAIDIVRKTTTPLFTSEINVFELVEGAYTSVTNNQQQVEKVFALLAKMTVLPFDRNAAIKAGIISGRLTREGKKIGEVDCLIAGIALVHGMPKIITKNKDHFEKIKEIEMITY